MPPLATAWGPSAAPWIPGKGIKADLNTML